tara:strand:- start:4610 stop:5323 length:714 start_codon:yes stop_codon:yes gene_type:complete
MKKEDFIPLIEIQSLDSKIMKLEKTISEELKRLDHLNGLNNKNEIKLSELLNKKNDLDKEVLEIEVEVDTLEKKIEKANQDLMKSTSNNEVVKLESFIKESSKKVEFAEENALTKMELLESLLIEISKSNEFKKNFPQTLQEFEIEIKNDNEKVFNSLDSAKERRGELINEMPTSLRSSYLGKKKVMDKPVCFLLGNRCDNCKTQIDQFTISSIQKYLDINFCPTCKKILVSKDILY